MNEKRFNDLIRRYQSGTCTEQEKELIEKWMKSRYESKQSGKLTSEERDELMGEISQSLFERIESIPLKRQVKLVPSVLWKAAAILVIGVAAGYGAYKFQQPEEVIAVGAKIKDFNPGGDKAILMLADGTEIELDSTESSKIPSQGAASISNLNGRIAYKTNGIAPETLYNTIATPRGGQYQVELEDGSKVWLNAQSSLRYPTSFSGSERVVELSGEAYFEISENKKMPFNVRMPSGQEVQVLGTHFNVMAYAEELALKATLLEGSVRITGTGFTPVTLVPNQQAQITREGKLSIIDDYDVTEAVAWKNGSFVFNDTDLEAIMRQVSRWYDVEVVVDNDIKSMQFFGIVSRRENVSAVLDLLKLTGTVDFEITGRKIIVKKGKD